MKSDCFITLFCIELFLVLTFLFFFSNNKRYKKVWNFYLVIAFGILFFFHIFKKTSSLPDLPSYMMEFNELRENTYSYIFTHGISAGKSENGWCVFCKTIQLFVPYGFAVIFVNSFVILSGYFYAIKKYSPFFWASTLFVLTGPYAQSLFVLRQHMAMAMVLFTYPYIINKKIVPYLLTIGLAFTMHQTAIIFLPIYFVYHYRGNIKKLAVFVICFGLFVNKVVLKLVGDVVASLSLVGYDSYLDSDEETNWKMGAYLILVLFCRLFIMKGKSIEYGINRLLTILLGMGCFIETLGYGLAFTSRLNMYFSSLLFLYIPQTSIYIKNNYFKYGFLLIFILFDMYMWFNSSNVNHRFYTLIF